MDSSTTKFQAMLKDYKLLSKVGEGTYGEVFKAVSLKTTEEGEMPQLVALKKHYVQPGEEGVSYCTLQELKYLKLVKDCSNVLQLQDTFIVQEPFQGRERTSMVMVTPYYSNDLTGALKQLKELSHIKCVFKQILQGLQQIHERGLMHRDIKAANILMNEGNVVLGDLGMMTSFRRDEPTSFPSNVITLWYRPLELLLGNENYGPEVDMWSAGCVLVELLTGFSLFPGRDERHQIEMILHRIGVTDLTAWGNIDPEQLKKWTQRMQTTSGDIVIPRESQLAMLFPNWPASARNLLENLLCAPSKRLTAAEALKHRFFYESPLPCEPSQIPRLVSSHEYELKLQRQKEPVALSANHITNRTTNSQYQPQYQQRNIAHAQRSSGVPYSRHPRPTEQNYHYTNHSTNNYLLKPRPTVTSSFVQ